MIDVRCNIITFVSLIMYLNNRREARKIKRNIQTQIRRKEKLPKDKEQYTTQNIEMLILRTLQKLGTISGTSHLSPAIMLL